jgi:UDP-N-acetylglucosamine/UDP-N-acetylgalactosamine diphosphorylase
MAEDQGVERLARVRAALKAAGQEHVLHFVDVGHATPEETTTLLNQVEALDLPALNSIFSGLGISKKVEPAVAAAADDYAPLSELASADSTPPALLQEWEQAGLAAIAQGKIAALVLGGGQGTRLGFDGPKGMYKIGLPSGKSIFQLLAERVLRVSALAASSSSSSSKGKHLPFYVMTSPLNHEATQRFFEENFYFGLTPADVFFFPQGTMPCFDLEGKLLLAGPGSLAQAPDGNGGTSLREITRNNRDRCHSFSCGLLPPLPPSCLHRHLPLPRPHWRAGRYAAARRRGLPRV